MGKIREVGRMRGMGQVLSCGLNSKLKTQN
jgi:hypothetical protein